MSLRVVVVAPGRGTYNREELGYFHRHHPHRADLLAEFDRIRAAEGQPALSALDSAASFSASVHRRGDNAAALIHACAYADFLEVAESGVEILGVTGNSMGWYIALACAGALGPAEGLRLVNTMGTLMHRQGAGGQVVYPLVDGDWRAVAGRRAEILSRVAEIDAQGDAALSLSIDLGGALVLAGDARGLERFEAAVEPLEARFPMRLPGHAGFHSPLVVPVAEAGRAALSDLEMHQPRLPLIDGRGQLWHAHGRNLDGLRDYTLGHQVVRPYDFAAAIRVAARELMPDAFVVLGPGATLSASVAQALVGIGWRGWADKQGFTAAQARGHRLIAMGRPDQRAWLAQAQP